MTANTVLKLSKTRRNLYLDENPGSDRGFLLDGVAYHLRKIGTLTLFCKSGAKIMMLRMFGLRWLFVLLVIWFSACKSSGSDDFNRNIMSLLFEQHDIHPEEVTLIIQRLSDEKRWVSHPRRAEERYIPASTSKIPHTLIALELDIANLESVFKWDGQTRSFDSWNQDQTLRSAYKRSAAWVYQDIVRTIGASEMKTWLSQFGYGNYQTITEQNVDSYWLTGPVKVSAEEQVKFLIELSGKTLPLSDKTYATAQTLFIERVSGTHRLYAKTGWKHNPPEMDVGWYVGWTENSMTSEIHVFALNMDMPKQGDQKKRKPIVMAALKAVGAWPE